MKSVNYLFLFIGLFGQLSLQTLWGREHLRFPNPQKYFTEVMQATMYDIERFGWWNMRLLNVTERINETFFDWHIEANVTYHDGFLMTIRHIDLTSIRDSFFIDTSTNQTIGMITGLLNFKDVVVGHDIEVVTHNETLHYTGTFHHRQISFTVQVTKNLHTDAIQVSSSLNSLMMGDFGMKALPYDRIGQVLGRQFHNSNHWDSAQAWATDIIRPTVARIVTSNEVEMPTPCFNCV